MQPDITAFFDEATFSVSYVVTDPATRRCAVIDSVLDYDAASGRTSTDSVDEIASHIEDNGLSLQWILETHVHADHITAAPYLKKRLGGQTAIGNNVGKVQGVFAQLFNVEDSFTADGRQFDRLLADNEKIEIGKLTVEVLHTPGHTPACSTYLIGDAAFVGDTLFMPDFGTARTDFPGGDAATLYRSIRRILDLPMETRLFMCHDYKAPGRDEYAWETTVAEQRKSNIHIHDGITENDFAAFRETRDATLSVPRLILPSVQVNMRAGEMPPAEDNGVRYLKIPVNAL